MNQPYGKNSTHPYFFLWSPAQNLILVQVELSLVLKSNYLTSPSQTQLGYLNCFQSQSKPGSDFEFVSEPSQDSSVRTFVSSFSKLTTLCHG